ncbi:hypothetical protein Gogos_011813, partial [Gossypium gossypioides]|nr:hypothetical protein [Gossypium gossypioides]
KPLSTISSLGLLNRFSVKDSGALQEKTIKIRMDEAVKLLKASSPSKTVLNDIFYGKKAHLETSEVGMCKDWVVDFDSSSGIINEKGFEISSL